MDDIQFWQAPTMQDVRDGEDKKLFTHISLFAGLGGSSTGMRLAGAHTLATNEFIDYRLETYSKNYPHCQVWGDDIRTLTGEEMLRRVGLKKGELDLLDGSPPCLVGSTEILVRKNNGPEYFDTLENVVKYDFSELYETRGFSRTTDKEWFRISDGQKTKENATVIEMIFAKAGNVEPISIICTPEHPLQFEGHYLPDHSRVLGTMFQNANVGITDANNQLNYLNALEWKQNDLIKGMYSNYFFVSSKEAPASDVYDITVEGAHNFYANGILVHNCSDFSTNNMGKREKQWGNEKKYSNKTQRVDDLFYEFARVLKEIQPKVFVAENVKGLTVGNAKTILGDRSKSIQSLLGIEDEDEISDVSKFNGKDKTIVETLRACGYKVSYQVMNCANYGIPQIRERLIFIGVRNDLPYSPSFPKPTTTTKHIIGKDAVGNFLFNGGNVVLNPDTMTYRYVKEFFPPHTTKLQVLNKMKDEGFGTYAHRYHRDNWDKVFYTVVAQDGNNVIHSLVDRYWSVCEVKKIQSFPDDFIDGLPPFKRIKVSASQLMDKDFVNNLNYMWHDQGHQSGDIRKIMDLTRWNWDEVKDQKIFDIDLKTNYDKTTTKYLHSSKAWENIGRAVPPLLYKAVGEHIYNNILKPLKNKV